MINWTSWLIWGFTATLVLTTTMAGSQGMGITRMNLPYLLGTMFTSKRGKARVAGFFVHMLNGWVFSFGYALGFYLVGGSDPWLGMLAGTLHGLFVIMALMPSMPAMHPRMAKERQGPTPVRYLEPPGFMALHYGPRTPISVMIAHVLFGLIMGLFYQTPVG